MKSLQSYLNESTNDRGWLDEKTCKQIISDYLELKAKQAKAFIAKKELTDMTNFAYSLYDNEDTPEDFTMEREFRDYVDKTLPDRCKNAYISSRTKPKEAKMIYALLGHGRIM